MSVSGVQSAQIVYGNGSTQKSNPVIDATTSRKSNTDSVSISDAARVMAQKDAVEQSPQTNNEPYQLWIDDGSYSKELIYIPEEFKDLYPYALDPTKLGMKLDVDRSAAYGKLSSAEREDLSEYISTVSEHYRDERDARGIQSNHEFQTLTKNNEQLRNEIHQGIRERMFSDPRTVELMEEFGIKF